MSVYQCRTEDNDKSVRHHWYENGIRYEKTICSRGGR